MEIFRNQFHETSVRVCVAPGTSYEELEEEARLEQSEGEFGPARRRLQRIFSKLCGQRDCRCGVVR